MNVRYFFVTDKVKNKEMRIEHCPTNDMIADYFTKPLQGSLFYKLRSLILNTDSSDKDDTVNDIDDMTASQECVG